MDFLASEEDIFRFCVADVNDFLTGHCKEN